MGVGSWEVGGIKGVGSYMQRENRDRSVNGIRSDCWGRGGGGVAGFDR